MADYTILLERFDLAVRLGIHPHEAAPQRVRLMIEVTVSYPAPVSADRIDEVLDYDRIHAEVRAMAETGSYALQETFCDAIAACCLADPRVTRVRVRSMKLDIYPDARVGCEVLRHRTAARR